MWKFKGGIGSLFDLCVRGLAEATILMDMSFMIVSAKQRKAIAVHFPCDNINLYFKFAQIRQYMQKGNSCKTPETKKSGGTIALFHMWQQNGVRGRSPF